MAKFVLTDPVITFTETGGTAATDISSSVAQVTISLESDDVEVTNFGSGGYRERIGGLKGGSFSMEMHQDFAAGSVDSLLWTSLGGTAAVTVRPGGGTVASATNPEYQFSVLVTGISPVDGAVGDLATQSVDFPITGSVTRGTGA